VDLYGFDARVYRVTCLVRDLDMNKAKGITQFPANSPIGQKIQLLQHDLLQLSVRPCFSTVVSLSFGNAIRLTEGSNSRSSRFTSEYLSSLFSVLRLNATQKVMLATGISRCEEKNFASVAIEYLKAEVPSIASSGGGALPSEILESLISMIRMNPSFVKDPVVSKKCFAALLKSHPEMAKLKTGEIGFTKDSSRLAPVLLGSSILEKNKRIVNSMVGDIHDDESTYESLASDILVSRSISNTIRDIGYSCTASTKAFEETLRHLGKIQDGSSDMSSSFSVLKESEVACMIAMMASTLNGTLDSTLSENLHQTFTGNLAVSSNYTNNNSSNNTTSTKATASSTTEEGPTTWNADVVSNVLLTFFDRLNWDLVIRCLDQKEYSISSPAAFAFVLSIYRNASGRTAAKDLPYASLFTPWKHSSNQLNILKQAVIAPPTVFTFAFTQRRQPPLAKDDSTVSYGTPNQAWCSVDLLETLVCLYVLSLFCLFQLTHSTPIHTGTPRG